MIRHLIFGLGVIILIRCCINLRASLHIRFSIRVHLPLGLVLLLLIIWFITTELLHSVPIIVSWGADLPLTIYENFIKISQVIKFPLNVKYFLTLSRKVCRLSLILSWLNWLKLISTTRGSINSFISCSKTILTAIHLVVSFVIVWFALCSSTICAFELVRLRASLVSGHLRLTLRFVAALENLWVIITHLMVTVHLCTLSSETLSLTIGSCPGRIMKFLHWILS